jgi:hypothetical protein
MDDRRTVKPKVSCDGPRLVQYCQHFHSHGFLLDVCIFLLWNRTREKFLIQMQIARWILSGRACSFKRQACGANCLAKEKEVAIDITGDFIKS